MTVSLIILKVMMITSVNPTPNLFSSWVCGAFVINGAFTKLKSEWAGIGMGNENQNKLFT